MGRGSNFEKQKIDESSSSPAYKRARMGKEMNVLPKSDRNDHNDHNLHVACPDLNNMRLIKQVQGVFSFCPQGPANVKSSNTNFEPDTSLEPLNIRPPSPTSATPSSHRTSTRRFTEELVDLRQQLTRMEQNQLDFYRHMGFDPPFLPSQQ